MPCESPDYAVQSSGRAGESHWWFVSEALARSRVVDDSVHDRVRSDS